MWEIRYGTIRKWIGHVSEVGGIETQQREATSALYALAASLTSMHCSMERPDIRLTVLDTPPLRLTDRLDTRSFRTTNAKLHCEDEPDMRRWGHKEMGP